MNAARHRVIFALAFSLASTTHAATCSEFLRLDYGAPQKNAVAPIVAELVARGYRNVPDWPKLVSLTRERILREGCKPGQTLEEIAEAAALAAGMTK